MRPDARRNKPNDRLAAGRGQKNPRRSPVRGQDTDPTAANAANGILEGRTGSEDWTTLWWLLRAQSSISVLTGVKAVSSV